LLRRGSCLLHNMSNTRLFIGRLSHHTRQRDLEELFGKYGQIVNCTMKGSYAFVEFEDPRDAEDALRALDGHHMDGSAIAVEFSHGGDRRYGSGGGSSGGGGSSRDRNYSSSRDGGGSSSGGGGGGGGRRYNPRSRFSPPRNTDYRIQIEGLPYDCGWQDLKDHFRQVGDVCFADVVRDRGGKTRGVVEFKYYEDMKEAVKSMDRTRIRGSTVYVSEDFKGDKNSRRRSSKSRSRSPKRRTRSRSPKRSPRRKSSKSRSPSPAKARSPSKSPRQSPPRSRSKSPPRGSGQNSGSGNGSGNLSGNKRARSPSKSPRRSRSGSRSPKRQKQRSRSPSKSPPKENDTKRSPSPRRSPSKSPRHSRSRSPRD